jgi:hypothetical protein
MVSCFLAAQNSIEAVWSCTYITADFLSNFGWVNEMITSHTGGTGLLGRGENASS